jgi:hypothetical protein
LTRGQFSGGCPDRNPCEKELRAYYRRAGYVQADAQIEGDCVVVTSPAVRDPVAVRYAWAKNPAGCNLYNSANLPASPFRTDAWNITQ